MCLVACTAEAAPQSLQCTICSIKSPLKILTLQVYTVKLEAQLFVVQSTTFMVLLGDREKQVWGCEHCQQSVS